MGAFLRIAVLGLLMSSSLAMAQCASSHPTTSLTSFALSPNASRIGAVADDGSVFWWDVATGARNQLLGCTNISEGANPIVFNANSSLLAVGDHSGTVFVFELPAGKIIHRLVEKKNEVQGIVFGGDSSRLAVNYIDGFSVWSLQTEKELMSRNERVPGTAFALNRAGTVLGMTIHHEIQFWDVDQAEIIRTIKLKDRQGADSLLFAHDGAILISALQQTRPVKPEDRRTQYDYEIAAWETASGHKVQTFSGASEAPAIFPMVVSGNTLLEVSYDGYLRQWDIETGKLKANWETQAGYVSADGQFLLRHAGEPGHLQLWKIGTPDQPGRAFVYKSATCGPGITDPSGKSAEIDTFRTTWMGSGITQDGYMLGFSGWIARDCTVLTRTNGYFETLERAQQELQRDIQRASRILKPAEADAKKLNYIFPEERVVLVFEDPHSHVESAEVVWIEGTTYHKLSTSSLPVALEFAKNGFSRLKK
jgi:WD40 repeat protein